MRFGLGVPRDRRTFMGNGSGVSRGDRNRNAWLERLRALVPLTNAIAGIDLAGKKQMVVVTDHDSRVIARRTYRCRAWDLGAALDWAAGRALAHGWTGVTVACEPTGHRWRVLSQLDAARQPFRSVTWVAALTVITGRDGGDLGRTRRLGAARFEQAVRREVIRRGRQKPCLRIVRLVFAAVADPAGVIAHRPGALERVALLLEDWDLTHKRIRQAELRMTAVLDELRLTGLVTTITGISAIGAAAILAETGDPRRFATGRAVVKHAGLAPREKLSGSFTGRTRLTGQGRPGLRLAAWRAVWGAQRTNPVYRARYQYLTTRERNKLTPTQAQTVIAAAILRHLHAIITTGQAWDPVTATCGSQHDQAKLAA